MGHGAGRGPQAHRVPAGAGRRADLPGPRLPRAPPPRPGRDLTGGRARRAGATTGTLAGAAGHRRRDRTLRGRVAARRGARSTCAGSRPTAGTDLAEAAAALRAALRGDLHTHSDWSDGGSPIEEMALDRDRARPRVPRAHRPLAPADGRQRAHRRAADASSSTSSTRSTSDLGAGFRLLTGIEVDILDDGALDQTDGAARPARRRRRPACTPSCAMTRPAMTRADGRRPSPTRTPNVLGHCTGRLVTGSRGTRGRAVDVRRRARSSRPAPSTTSRSRSTPGPSGATRRSGCCAWPLEAGLPVREAQGR